MPDLWLPLVIGAFSILIAIGQLFIDQGKVGIKTQAVQVDREALGIELARQNATRMAELDANNFTLTVKITAMMESYATMLQDSTRTKAELDVTKAKLAISEQRVAELTQKVAALEGENTQLHSELAALRKQVAAQAPGDVA